MMRKRPALRRSRAVRAPLWSLCAHAGPASALAGAVSLPRRRSESAGRPGLTLPVVGSASPGQRCGSGAATSGVSPWTAIKYPLPARHAMQRVAIEALQARHPLTSQASSANIVPPSSGHSSCRAIKCPRNHRQHNPSAAVGIGRDPRGAGPVSAPAGGRPAHGPDDPLANERRAAPHVRHSGPRRRHGIETAIGVLGHRAPMLMLLQTLGLIRATCFNLVNSGE